MSAIHAANTNDMTASQPGLGLSGVNGSTIGEPASPEGMWPIRAGDLLASLTLNLPRTSFAMVPLIPTSVARQWEVL